MVNCNVQTPLGVARLAGDENGVSSITLLNQNDPIDKKIPEALEACASQLRDYFNGDLAEFSFALNPKGTDFQKKVRLFLIWIWPNH